MVNLIREQYATLYFANKCSGAFIFCVSLYFLMIILPFFIGFTTADFWILKKTTFQTPKVSSFDEYYLKILMNDGTQKIYTNIPEIQLQLGTSQPGAFYFSQKKLSQNEQDEFQAKTSNFTSQFFIDLLTEQQIKQIREIQILIFYEYDLDETVSMNMQGYAFASLKSPHGISSASTIGQLRLSQRHPIYSGKVPRTKYNYSSYYNALGQVLLDPIEIVENSIYNRNESIFYDYISYIIPPTSLLVPETTTRQTENNENQYPIAFQTTTNNTTNNNTTNNNTTTTTVDIQKGVYLPVYLSHSTQLSINMTLQIPNKEMVMYQTEIIEALKFSWMQYLSIFLIFWFFGQMILEFVVSNKVFATQAVVNIPIPLKSYSKLKLD
ncbi:unnamed protein product [Paramecium sonneborni]|uniref:Transmembrane protein 231 n=1 Tax=Paramecium sonneborni TaxID=65129 RepID=A0A8S1QXU6_9CILI|nr:unnamed protein product [Paramecium sonneborni]